MEPTPHFPGTGGWVEQGEHVVPKERRIFLEMYENVSSIVWMLAIFDVYFRGGRVPPHQEGMIMYVHVQIPYRIST